MEDILLSVLMLHRHCRGSMWIPYIFRVAISNNRILSLVDGQVTLSFKDSATEQIKLSTLPAQEFIRRFLEHVLPDHFVKVRYYGLLSPSHRHLLDQARQLLTPTAQSDSWQADPEPEGAIDPPRCPKCGSILRLIERLKPRTRWPP